MTSRDQIVRRVEARRQGERNRIRGMAAERRRAAEALREAERRLALAAIASELSEREVAVLAGVHRSTLRSWAER